MVVLTGRWWFRDFNGVMVIYSDGMVVVVVVVVTG